MESLRGELSSLYKKQFLKLDAAENAGKDTTRMRMQLLENYVKDLNEQNEMLIQMVEETSQIRDELKCRESQKAEQLQRLKSCLTESECEIDCLRDSKADLACELSNLNSELARVTRRAEEAEKDNELLNKTLAEQEAEITKSHLELDQMDGEVTGVNDEVECLRDKLGQAMAEMEEMCQCNKQLEQCVAELKEETDNLKDEITERETEEQKIRRSSLTMDRKLSTQEQELEDMTDHLNGTTHELNETREELAACQQCVQQIKQREEELSTDLDKADCAIQSLEVEKTLLEEKFEKFKDCHNYTDDEFCQMSEELQTIQRKLREICTEKEEGDKLLEDMENELHCRTSELEELRESFRQS
ncbi:myosin-10, partial [Aplysia californica]|uniref:Myosin-10 n=1 Tax=Aplysia californica TaxID=6500 RepID=A0ABM1ADF4_APLCA